MRNLKETVIQAVNDLRKDFYEVSTYIGENPELGHEEFKACEALTTLLKKHGFDVTIGTSGLATAFEAVFDSGKEGPSIGYMAEYDALPGLGHACGHNLIGTTSVVAGIALSKVVGEVGGKVYVYGTPAEETRGGKVTMAEQHVFDHLDAAMMVHPYAHYEKSGHSLAIDAIQFEFFGKPAHAAASPHEGINALDAVIQTFNSINALRQHVTSDVRIHGIIPHGGDAANIVPEYAVGQFYVRAASRKYLNELVKKVKACAEGAALQTGATLKISNYELSYDEMTTNQALSEQFTENLIALGVDPNEIEERGEGGSIDMGNVSQVAPAIHPYIKICDAWACHTPQFRDAAMSDEGREGMLLGAKALATTGYDLLTNQELLAQVKAEFQARL